MSQNNKWINKVKKKQNEIFIISTVLFMILVFMSSLSYIKLQSNEIDPNFIAVFKGEWNNQSYSTYIYEKTKKSGQNLRIEYQYINTTTNTQLDSTNDMEKITRQGTIKKRKEIFKIAQKNHADSYVIENRNSKIYSVDEFKQYFN